MVAFLSATGQLTGQTSNGTYIQSGAFGGLIDPGINPLRPTGDYVEIQELINTANYINTQVSDATASIVEIQDGGDEKIVPIVDVELYSDSHQIRICNLLTKKEYRRKKPKYYSNISFPLPNLLGSSCR